MIETLGEMMRAFDRAMEEAMRHPLKALQDWWEDATECPVCGPSHGRRRQ